MKAIVVLKKLKILKRLMVHFQKKQTQIQRRHFTLLRIPI